MNLAIQWKGSISLYLCLAAVVLLGDIEGI